MESFQFIGYQMLMRLIDLLMLNSTVKIESHLLAILRSVWKAITNNTDANNNNCNIDQNLNQNNSASSNNNNNNNNNDYQYNYQNNINNINQLGWDSLSLLSSVPSPATLSLLIISLIDIFEANKWNNLELIVDTFSLLSDSSSRTNMYCAPVVRTLLQYAESLINPIITPNKNPKKGGILDRLIQGIRDNFGFSNDQNHIELVVSITRILAVVESFMSRPLGEELSSDSVRTSFNSTFEEDMKNLLSIQLFLCVSLRSDFRVSESALILPFNGNENSSYAYSQILDAQNLLKNYKIDMEKGNKIGKLDFSALNEEYRANTGTENKEFLKIIIEDNIENIVIKSEMEEKIEKSFHLLWRVIVLFSKQNMPVGHLRSYVLPVILQNLETSEITIRLLCEAKKKGKKNISKLKKTDSTRNFGVDEFTDLNSVKNANSPQEQIWDMDDRKYHDGENSFDTVNLSDKRDNSKENKEKKHIEEKKGGTGTHDVWNEQTNADDFSTDVGREEDLNCIILNTLHSPKKDEKNDNKIDENSKKDFDGKEPSSENILTEEESDEFSSIVTNLRLYTLYVLNLLLTNSRGKSLFLFKSKIVPV